MKEKIRDWLIQILARFGYRIVKAPKRAIVESPEGNLDVRLDFLVYDHMQQIGERPFFIVQIGAFDGTSFGDAMHDYFADSRFQGVLVEPQPAVFSRLKETYKGNEQVRLENAAIAHEDGEVDLYTVDVGQPDLPDWLEGCASLSKEPILKFENEFPNLREHMHVLKIPALTLGSLLNKYEQQTVDLLQIDVEGFDFEVIKMVDYENFKPAIIRFENEHLSPEMREECYDFLMERGYKIAIERPDVMAYSG